MAEDQKVFGLNKVKLCAFRRNFKSNIPNVTLILYDSRSHFLCHEHSTYI